MVLQSNGTANVTLTNSKGQVALRKEVVVKSQLKKILKQPDANYTLNFSTNDIVEIQKQKYIGTNNASWQINGFQKILKGLPTNLTEEQGHMFKEIQSQIALQVALEQRQKEQNHTLALDWLQNYTLSKNQSQNDEQIAPSSISSWSGQIFRLSDLPQYLDLSSSSNSSFCYFNDEAVPSSMVDPQTHRCVVPNKVGAYDVRLDDAVGPQILVLPKEIDTEQSKVTQNSDGTFEITIGIDASTKYYREIQQMQQLQVNGSQKCKLVKEKLVCKVQQIPQNNVQIVNADQVLANKALNLTIPTHFESVNFPSFEIAESLQIIELKLKNESDDKLSLLFYDTDQDLNLNKSYSMFLPEINCQEIFDRVQMEMQAKENGCWVMWTDDSLNDIAPDLLTNIELDEPASQNEKEFNQTSLWVDHSLGGLDFSVNSSSLIMNALIHGLSKGCKVYNVNYLRCQDLQYEMSGVLRELNLQIQKFLTQVQVERIPIQTNETVLQLNQRNEIVFQLSDKSYQEIMQSFPFTCGLKSNIVTFGGYLFNNGKNYVCTFENLSDEMISPATLLLTINGSQEIILHENITILRPPTLSSVSPNWIATPIAGQIIELKGERLHQISSIELINLKETILVHQFNNSNEKIQFELPQIKESVYIQVKASNKIPLLIGNGLQIEMLPSIGFTAQDTIVVKFFLSQALDKTQITCVATSGESTVEIQPIIDGCQMQCLLPSHRLTPGDTDMALSLQGEPELRNFGKINMVALKRQDLKIANHSVFAGSQNSLLRIELSQQLDLDHQIWCTYQSNTKRKIQAVKDDRVVWCQGIPQESGTYTVGLTYDEINYINVSEQLIVHDKASVVVTDVAPRLIPLKDITARKKPFEIQLFGRGLNLLQDQMVEIYLDDEPLPVNILFIEFEESIIKAKLPRSPQNQLYVLLHTIESKSQKLAEVRINTIPIPSVEAQAISVYEGEAIFVKGMQFSDQLALWCIADDGSKALSTVINTNLLSCPAELLQGQRGLAPPNRRTIQIYSESLLELISDGLNPRVSVEIVPIPQVIKISRDIWPANSIDVENLNLTLSGQVLDHQILVKYGKSGPYECQIQQGFALTCPSPSEKIAQKSLQILLQYAENLPFIDSLQSIQILNWPLMRELHPNVLVRGVEGQQLLIEGDNLKFSQHVAQFLNLSNGFQQEITSLSDKQILLTDLPVLPISKGSLSKIDITMDMKFDPLVAPLDLFIVDQPIIQGISPKAIVWNEFGFKVLLRVNYQLYQPIGYTCFLQSKDMQLLDHHPGRIVGEHLLECEYAEAKFNHPGSYFIGISARPDVLPLTYESLFVLQQPKLTKIEGNGNQYLMKNESATLELFGRWDWYQELPRPLIILKEFHNQTLLHIIPADYTTASSSSILFNIPPINDNHISVELSQTGHILGDISRSSMNLTFVEKPFITEIRPHFIDYRFIGPMWVGVSGYNFYRDGGLSEKVTNLKCRSNDVTTELVYYNTTYIECLIQAEYGLQSHIISLSVNFGEQWIHASQSQYVNSMVLPEVASVFPNSLASNLMTRVQVTLTHSAQSVIPLIGLQGFEVLEQISDSENEHLVYLLVQPQEPTSQPFGRIQISMQLSNYSDESYISQYNELNSTGGISIFGSSPTSVLAYWGWTEIILSGSHLDIQPLYCSIGDRLYPLEPLSTTSAKCLVSLLEDEDIKLVTELGQYVPGKGHLTVIQGLERELQPQLRYAVQGEVLEIHGNGFRPNQSFCYFESESITQQKVQAQVINSEMLKCELPQIDDSIFSVQVHNEFAHDDLYKYLWSQKLVLETVPSIWKISKEINIQQKEQEINVDNTIDPLLHQTLDKQMPLVILDGSGTEIRVDMQQLNISDCQFGPPRIAVQNNQTCHLSSQSLKWSSLFDYDNVISLNVIAQSSQVNLMRTIPIVKILQIINSWPVIGDNIEIYLSPGSSSNGWEKVEELGIQIEFKCRYVYSHGNISESVESESSQGLHKGHFNVRCPIDWNRPALSMTLDYRYENQTVSLDFTNYTRTLTSVIAQQIGDQIVRVGPIQKISEEGLFCRFERPNKGIQYAQISWKENRWAYCQFPRTQIIVSVTIIKVSEEPNPHEIILTWPTSISKRNSTQSQITATSSTDQASIDTVTPSLFLADECQLLSEYNDLIMIEGHHLSHSTNFYLNSSLLNCTLGGHTSAICYGARGLACQILQDAGLQQFSVHLENKQATSFRISKELPLLGYIGHDYRVGCQFQISDQVKEELTNASRSVLCVYDSFGQSFVGDPLNAIDNSLVCPQSKNFFQYLEVSIFASGPLGSMLNITKTPCVLESIQKVTPQLAWINPPTLACGIQGKYLLNFEGPIEQDSRALITMENSQILNEAETSEGSLAFEVDIQIKCAVNQANLTSKYLDIRLDGISFSKVHLMVFRPLNILKAIWSSSEQLQINVDRPWDLQILINTIGPSMYCVFQDIAVEEAVIIENQIFCMLPDAPPDKQLQLSLGIGGLKYVNSITIAPYSLERPQQSNQSSDSSVPSLNGGQYKLLAPAEIIYGLNNSTRIEIEFKNSESESHACLFRAQQLPIVVVNAEVDSERGLLSCSISIQLLNRLEQANVSSLEVAHGQGLGAMPIGDWLHIPARQRILISSIYPQSVVIHPGRNHEVILEGNFRTLMNMMDKTIKSMSIWVRLVDGGPHEVFSIKEVRESFLFFDIPGAAIAVGTQRNFEIIDVPIWQSSPRILARSIQLLSFLAFLTIEEFKPRIALLSSPSKITVTLSINRAPEQGRIISCAQKRSGDTALTWSLAHPISQTSYQCEIEQGRNGVRELGLGLKGSELADSQLLTDLVRVVLLPFDIIQISPSSGPSVGGTTVRIEGSGFLSLSPYGGGLMCQFGFRGKLVEARPISDKILECEVPAKPPSRVTISLVSQDPEQHLIDLKQMNLTYTYYKDPVARSVFPTTLQRQGAALNITIVLKEPLDTDYHKTTYCKLQDSVPSRALLFSKVAQSVIQNPTTIQCIFPSIDWLYESNLCLLSLSFNEAADFSIVYHTIRVVNSPRGIGSGQFMKANYSQGGTVILKHLDLENNTSSAIGCLTMDEYNEPSWFLPATKLNSSHITCMDGAGTLAKGGSISLSDSASGLVSLSPLKIESQEEEFQEEPQKADIDVDFFMEHAKQQQTSESDEKNDEPTINEIQVVIKQRSELELIVIPHEEDISSIELPSILIQGWGFSQGKSFDIAFQAQQPNRTVYATTVSDNENLLTLNFSQQTNLVEGLRNDWGGLFQVIVTENQTADLPVLILSRPKILNASIAPHSSESSLNIKTFVQILTENFPSGGEINIWCEFTYYIEWEGFKILTDAWVVETVIISKQDKIIQRKFWCELPSIVLESKDSNFYAQDGRDWVSGRLIYGAWNRKSEVNQNQSPQFNFTIDLLRPWRVRFIELRGLDIYVYGNNFPTDSGRLTCLIETSGQRLSHAIIINSSEIHCSIQSFSGVATVRIRDLTTGLSSQSFELQHQLPTLLSVTPTDLYLPPTGLGELPMLYIYGEQFTQDCYCLLGGEESLNSTWLNSTTLRCSIYSTQALNVQIAKTADQKSWRIQAICPQRAWSSQQITLWPRRGSKLLSVDEAAISETAFLEGANQLELIGERLHSELSCVQKSTSYPYPEYESPLTDVDSRGNTAKCEVAKEHLQDAPLAGLIVQLSLRGPQVIESFVNLTFYPKAIVAVDDSSAILHHDTEGQEVILNAQNQIGDLSDDAVICLYRIDYFDESHPLNVTYLTNLNVIHEKELLSCPFPIIRNYELDYLWLALRASKDDRGGYTDISTPVRIFIKPAPRILLIDPRILPAGEPTFGHRVNIEQHVGIDPDLHALRVGDADDLTHIYQDAEGLYFDAPQHEAGFQRLILHLKRNWHERAAKPIIGKFWTTNVGIEYFELPQAYSVIPNLLPAGLPASGVNDKVIITGSNFTRFTECEFNQTTMLTVWLASNMLECQIPHSGIAGDSIYLRLKERGLYSRSEGLKITFTSQSFVYRLEPSKILVGRSATHVKVYVADTEGMIKSVSSPAGYFCKFGARVVRVHAIKVVEDLKEDQYTSHNRVKLPPVARLVLHCRSPITYDPDTLRVEILTPSGTTFSTYEGNNTLEYVARPSFTSVSPPVIPMGETFLLTFSGSNFVSDYNYKCTFTFPPFVAWETFAWPVDTQTLNCPVPYSETSLLNKTSSLGRLFLEIAVRVEWASHGVGLTTSTEIATLETLGLILLYQKPIITSIWPSFGTVNGGTPVYVSGQGFDLGLAQNIKCKFGEIVVDARVITPSTLLKCISPATGQGEVIVKVSIDNREFFSANNSDIIFTYITDPDTSSSVAQIVPSLIGSDQPNTLMIIGSGFPSSNLLAGGFPLCSFNFVSSSLTRVTHGTILDGENIECPSPPAAPYRSANDCVDQDFEWCLFADIQISFNGEEYFLVDATNRLTYIERPAIKSVEPTFSFANSNISVTAEGSRFNDVILAKWGISSFSHLDLSIPDSASATNTKFGIPRAQHLNISQVYQGQLFGDTMSQVELQKHATIGFSYSKIKHQYFERPKIKKIQPVVVSGNEGSVLSIVGEGFKNTTDLSCKFGHFWALSSRYINNTHLECVTPQFSCPSGELLLVSITLNGEELTATTDSDDEPLHLVVTDPPEFYELSPRVAIAGATDIKIRLFVTGIIDTESLSCKFDNLTLNGTFFVDSDGNQQIHCTIPSHVYIALSNTTEQNIPSPSVVSVEASNDRTLFSESGLKLHFIYMDQIRAISPSNGPSTGNTNINITIEEIPDLYSDGPGIFCQFPGYEYNSIPAYQVSKTLIQCTSPPQIEDAEGTIKLSTMSLVPVKIHIYSSASLTTFYYAYTHDVQVKRIEPVSTVPPQGPDPKGLVVVVHGQNFAAVHGQSLRCRIGEEGVIGLEVFAHFINNHTLSCEVPGSALQRNWAERELGEVEVKLVIEISLNGGQQYTHNDVGLIIREADTLIQSDYIASVSPAFAYVSGGTLLTVNYDFAFDPTSPRTRCVFYREDPSDGIERIVYVPIFQIGTNSVQCFAPPAYMMTDELFANGGIVHLYLSSNGRDLSSNYQPFRYRPSPRVTDVIPYRLLAMKSQIIQVLGVNFFNITSTVGENEAYENAEGAFAKLTAVSDPERYRIQPIFYINSTCIELNWPAGAFESGEQVRLEITLDKSTLAKAPAALTILGQVILGTVRPKIVHQPKAGEEAQLIYAETLTDLLDTESLGLLRCRFQKAAEPEQPNNVMISPCHSCDPNSCTCTEGRFLNKSTIYCPMPRLSLGPVEIDISVDPEASYSIPQDGIPVRVNVVEQISEITFSQQFSSVRVFDERTRMIVYYETTEDQVYFALDGSWPPNKLVYLRIGGATVSAIVSQNQNAQFKLPRGLRPGIYPIYVSTDGGTTFIHAGIETPITVEIRSCPAGFACGFGSISSCPPGSYCPQTGGSISPVLCPLGFYADQEGLNGCKACPIGSYCPSLGISEYRTCPPGFMCQTDAIGTLNQLEPCPAGHYCELDAPPKLCPNGAWCPEGTTTPVVMAGNYSTPQYCKDGVRCETLRTDFTRLLADPTTFEDLSGSRDTSGIADCSPGKYCNKGISQDCPIGSFCGQSALKEFTQCPPGQFQSNTGSFDCKLCPPGSFCFYPGQAFPFKCKPGFTCQYEGESTPVQLCPAGSYCPGAIAANFTDSKMQINHRPVLCQAKTYCLWGVYTNIVNSSNPQAAQVCIAGTFCGEGSATPNGKGVCRAGYYCPPNSSEMMDCPVGYYTPDTGFTAPQPCPVGTYNNKLRSPFCNDCTKGHACPFQGMIAPQRCGKGTFSKKTGETQCTDCPQGTYSDELELTAEESCKPCEAQFLCEEPGLKMMKNAKLCEEGYLCGARTTRTVMLTNPSPGGYYTAAGAGSLQDAFLCPARRYCARGTSQSKVQQNECLPGFFCPLGTYASLKPDGSFDSDIRMVPREILIRLIENLIVENTKINSKFDIVQKEIDLEEANKEYLDEINKPIGLQDQYYREKLETLITASEWNIKRWNDRDVQTKQRAEYLRVNLTVGSCPEDEGLPQELVEMYFQGGLNLACPRGTSSDRGSYCLGQCTKPRSSTQPISILDPMDYRDYSLERGVEDPLAPPEEIRRLQMDGDQWNPRWDKTPTYTLQPLQTARISIDFRDVPSGFEYNEHYSLIILGKTESEDYIQENLEQEPWQIEHELGYRQQALPFYFSAANDMTVDNPGTVKRAVLELKLFNIQDFDVEFRVGIYLYHGLFIPYLSYLANKVSIEFFQANRQLMGMSHTYGVLISEMQMAGVTIPYNAPDLGNEPLFYIDMTSTAEGVNIGTRGLDKDIYDTTFWQSKQVNAVIMPWIPYFSNCEGYDQHMVLYDVFERGGRCTLPPYEDIRIVNPVPSTGLDPVADRCAPNEQYPELICRFEEPLMEPVVSSSRWYELEEERDLFYVTRSPIPIEYFKAESEESDNPQTFYVRLIEDGSDELVSATFHPQLGQPKFDPDGNPVVPTLVELNFFYYQQSKDVKLMSKVDVYLKEYRAFIASPGSDPVYRLRINYEALSYFDLINTFQFTVPIYILLFTFISIVLILGGIVFWLVNLQFSTFKRPPAIRFYHLARVTFIPPATGALLACVPALMVAAFLQFLQFADISAEISARWTDFGGEVTSKQRIDQVRGRLGLAFIIISIIFLLHGADTIINQPSEDEEEEILQTKKQRKELNRLELSLDESNQEEDLHETEDDKEDQVRIVRAIDWKRRHFFVACMLVALFLMVKLEFSYSELFGKSVLEFLIIFTVADLILEQLLIRVLMSEALLVSPILGAIVTTEFIMTMGADDFQSFITAYFTQTVIVIFSRSYAGPWLEKLEARIQGLVISLAQKHRWAERLFKGFLVRQLNAQIQMINLSEYEQRDDDDEKNGGIDKDTKRMVLEKAEGLEALLGSVSSYAAQTQALFLIPVTLLFLILFAIETKIPQGYQIRQADLTYYLLFSLIIVLPRMVIDAFLLHVLETVHGYKIYDYFTYCDYRFRIRSKKWVIDSPLDRSIAHAWRSIDNMNFSSQYYYIISLTTWGILFLYLGLTAMIRNLYNPFADPVLLAYVGAICGLVSPTKMILRVLAGYIHLWEVVIDENQRVDVAALNRLDHTNNVKKLVRNIQTNPFRHKFMRVNREWLIHNIALILGGKHYLVHAGPELQYLQAIYQRAVNAEAIDVRLRKEQTKIAKDLALMPYNARALAQKRGFEGANEQVVVSDDSVSDIPAPQWRIPQGLTKEPIQKLARLWLSFARQTMRLKAIVSDLVAKQLKAHCQRCRSVYRLQVIQKIGFNQLCDKFRTEHQGIPFTIERWRRFFIRRQIFMTLCMECAYIDNLNAAHIVEQDGDLQRLMAENALKNIGAHDQFVAQKLQLPHIRRIIHKWVWLSRSNLLHKQGFKYHILRKAFRAQQRFQAEQEAIKEGLKIKTPEPRSTEQTPEPSDATPPKDDNSDSLTISSVEIA